MARELLLPARHGPQGHAVLAPGLPPLHSSGLPPHSVPHHTTNLSNFGQCPFLLPDSTLRSLPEAAMPLLFCKLQQPGRRRPGLSHDTAAPPPFPGRGLSLSLLLPVPSLLLFFQVGAAPAHANDLQHTVSRITTRWHHQPRKNVRCARRRREACGVLYCTVLHLFVFCERTKGPSAAVTGEEGRR